MSESIECPFCGSTDISDGELLMQKTDGTRVTQSRCNGCGALGPEALTDGPDFGSVRAIAAWNRRTPQPVTPAGGEVEARAKAMFEAGTVGANSAPWEQQWEPTKEYWRAKAAHPPVADSALDTKRLDWLSETAETAYVSMCFELDGGVHMTIEAPGAEMVAYREKDSIRAAIDAALNQRGGG